MTTSHLKRVAGPVHVVGGLCPVRGSPVQMYSAATLCMMSVVKGVTGACWRGGSMETGSGSKTERILVLSVSVRWDFIIVYPFPLYCNDIFYFDCFKIIRDKMCRSYIT